MKKFTLSVTSPCHENWEQMTPDQRGRFCASCQKIVVDFTAMSDRQVADYFKKSAVSTCGRFYRDQLNREMVIPKKGLPWLRYFFQFTWPALLLFLKACGQKEKVTGKTLIEERKTAWPVLTMGVAVQQITPVDTVKLTNAKKERSVCSTVVGDVEIQPSIPIGEIVVDKDTSLMEQVTGEKPDSDSLLGDTTVVADPFPNELRSVVLGGFSVVRRGVRQKEVPLMPAQRTAEEQKSLRVLVFPNPVQSGQQLTVASKQNIDGHYQVFSMEGLLMKTDRLLLTDQQTVSIFVQNWPAATYILRVVSNDGTQTFTQKIIVQ